MAGGAECRSEDDCGMALHVPLLQWAEASGVGYREHDLEQAGQSDGLVCGGLELCLGGCAGFRVRTEGANMRTAIQSYWPW